MKSKESTHRRDVSLNSFLYDIIIHSVGLTVRKCMKAEGGHIIHLL
jgi:hypothetical protein